jgi:hypothetical protein
MQEEEEWFEIINPGEVDRVHKRYATLGKLGHLHVRSLVSIMSAATFPLL